MADEVGTHMMSPAATTQDSAVTGLRIVSDGTAEGTHVLMDGVELKGVTDVEWKINTKTRNATVLLTLRGVQMDVDAAMPPEVAEALGVIQAWTNANQSKTGLV